MIFKNDLYTFLSANLSVPTAVTSNVGNVRDGYLVFQRILTNRVYAHDGNSGLVMARYQFDAYANKKQDAVLIINELKTLIDNYSGLLGESKVQGVFIVNEFDTLDQDSGMYREEIEFNIQYYE